MLQDLNLEEYDKYPITNKTRQYLIPSLLDHGNPFKKAISQFNFVAAGLWDDDNREAFDKYQIGFLVNARKSSQRLFKIEHVVDSYYFGELMYGKLQMLVIELPDHHKQAYDAFLESKYSKMYVNPKSLFEGLTSNFAKSVKNKCMQVCTNDNFYRTELAMELGVPRSMLADELDNVLVMEQEIFNYKKKENES